MRVKKNPNSKHSSISSGLNNKGFIGVDVGSHHIKMVHLSGRSLDQLKLEGYVITPLPQDVVVDGKVHDDEQLVATLQLSYAQLKSNNKNIIAAMPSNLTTLQNFIYSAEEGNDLEGAAEFEAAQITSIDEVNFDYQVLGPAAQGAGQEVLLVVARKEDIEPRVLSLKAAGLTPMVLDVETYAIINAYSHWMNTQASELEDQIVVVFDIGMNQTQALVLRQGKLLFKQEPNFGSAQMARDIQRVYQLSREEAETLMHAEIQPQDFQQNIVEPFNQQMAMEIQRVLQFFYTTASSGSYQQASQILLTGASAQLPGLAEKVSAQTNTPARVVNPVEYTALSSKIDHAAFKKAAADLTVAFGLCLRGFE